MDGNARTDVDVTWGEASCAYQGFYVDTEHQMW